MLPVSLKKLLIKMLSTPMILETGTSGIWTYRKWSNGTAECWGIIEQSFPPSNGWTAWGQTKYANLNAQSFPTGLFNAVPKVTATASKNSSSGMPIVALMGISSTGFSGYINELSGNSTYTYTVKISVYAIGQWATINPSTHTMTISTLSLNQMTKAEIQALIEASGNQFKDNDTWIPSDLT